MPQRETARVIKINWCIHHTLLCFTYRNERHKIAFEDVLACMNRPVTKLLHKKRSKVAVKSPFWFSVSVPAASQDSVRLIPYRTYRGEAVIVHDRCRFFIPFYHSDQFDVVKEVLKSTHAATWRQQITQFVFCLERGGLQSYVVRAHITLAIQQLNNLMIPYVKFTFNIWAKTNSEHLLRNGYCCILK